MKNNKYKGIISVLFVLAFLLFISSCVVTQNLSYSRVSPFVGVNRTNIEVSDFFVGVIEDMYSWKIEESDDPVIEVAISSFAESISRSSYAYGVDAQKTGYNKYNVFFRFTDFSKLIKQLTSEVGEQDLLVVMEKDGIKELRLNVSLENYDTLCKIVPFLGDEAFMVWGPVYNNPPHDYLTEEDYKELVAFILGEEGPDCIDKSTVTLKIGLPYGSKVIKTNGTVADGGFVEFSFPLIDFLLLHEPIVFDIIFM